MKRVLPVLAVALGAAAPALAAPLFPVPTAPAKWEGNGHYYELVIDDLQATFDGAVAAAASRRGGKGYLATVTSQEEQEFLDQLVMLPFFDIFWGEGEERPSEPVLRPTLAWLGGSDADEEGVWKWVTGPEAGQEFSFYDFNDWASGEPNNFGDGGVPENGLVGWWNGTGWNDIYDNWYDGPIAYVVEYDVAPVPLPAAFPLLAGALGLLGVAARRRKA